MVLMNFMALLVLRMPQGTASSHAKLSSMHWRGTQQLTGLGYVLLQTEEAELFCLLLDDVSIDKLLSIVLNRPCLLLLCR